MSPPADHTRAEAGPLLGPPIRATFAVWPAFATRRLTRRTCRARAPSFDVDMTWPPPRLGTLPERRGAA